jgi:hypothetical protein
VSLRELALSEDVRRILVLIPLPELRLNAGFFEGAAQEGDFRGYAREPDIAGLLQPNLVESGREVVRHRTRSELAERLRPGDRRLAVLAERLDCAAKLLRPRKSVPPRPDLRDQGAHRRITGSVTQSLDDLAQHGAAPAHHPGERIVRDILDQPLRQIELKDERPLVDTVADEPVGELG